MGKNEVDAFVNNLFSSPNSWSTWNYNPKMGKALNMLKKEKHNLMVKEEDDEIYGVIKSQRNVDLLYAVALREDGTFLCGTQNLRRCGGLRGSGPCKHIYLMALVLCMTGTKPEKILPWYKKALKINYTLSKSDKETMRDIFEEYAKVLSGEFEQQEVEWREIETYPEDYLALG
ncbi:MAG: hypothetical protein ACTSPV_17340 [Candidatus Hodarchaeales archaeon]